VPDAGISALVGVPALLMAVGVLAGVVSTVVGLASVISYPALLALGLPPVAANVSNTVSLVFTSLGAAAGSRPELVGQRRRVLGIGALTAAGGAVGAALLLRTPAGAFALAVPVLIALASVALLLQPAVTRWANRSDRVERVHPAGSPPSRPWLIVVAAAAVYVGYFGAAGGVLMLAALGGLLRDDLVRLNALKNVVSGLANAVAAVGFVLFGPVQWSVVVPLGAGFLIGGRLGPGLARRLPARSLRGLIAGSGLAVAAVLAVRTYG
jgi:uncharacterized membrane protein YfcA